MKIEYQLTQQDIQESWQPLAKQQRWNQSFSVAYILGYPCLVSLLVPGTIGTKYACFTGVFAFSIVAFYLIGRQQVSTLWKLSPHLHSQFVHEVTAELLIFSTDLSRTENKWRAYTHWVETKNLFILYQSSQYYSAIPKRAFADEAQLQEYRAMLSLIDADKSAPPISEP